VSSDGSTDKTVEEIKQIKSKKVVVVDNKIRKGKAFRLNQIRNICTSDILVVLDADIKILGADFIEKLTKPILQKRAVLTSSRMLATKPGNWVEKALYASVYVKDELFGKISGGKNVYTCHGVARAFSKDLYKRLAFEKSVGEDAYSYLFCIKKGLSFEYARNAIVYIKLPSTLYDYKKQRKRFLNSRVKMEEKFGSEFVRNEYHFPKKIVFEVIRKELIKYGFWLVVYLFINLYVTVSPVEQEKIGYLWEIAKSSKKLNN
jgi:cellulose synthase/poly-beta-1,6-N-acetylglucosamine synthase-like glycosyltransferase